MYEELSKNVRRSRLLVLGFIVVVCGMGYLFGALAGGSFTGLAIAAVISIGMAWSSWATGDKVVLRLSGAREATREDHARLHNLVEGLSIAAGLPKPNLYVIEDDAPNAFATGRDPEHSSLAFTTGLLSKMNRVELEGVVAHELAHVANRDTLVMAIVATLVGVVVLLADWILRAFFWGGFGRRDNGGGNIAILLPIGFILALLMPIFAQIMRGAVGRRREYYADMRGVQLTRYPPGLLGALRKLQSDTTVVRTAAHATSHLWIESPLQGGGDGWQAKLNRLFDSHPPLEERIRVLEDL